MWDNRQHVERVLADSEALGRLQRRYVPVEHAFLDSAREDQRHDFMNRVEPTLQQWRDRLPSVLQGGAPATGQVGGVFELSGPLCYAAVLDWKTNRDDFER